jgi:hypothetical protein
MNSPPGGWATARRAAPISAIDREWFPEGVEAFPEIENGEALAGRQETSPLKL